MPLHTGDKNSNLGLLALLAGLGTLGANKPGVSGLSALAQGGLGGLGAFQRFGAQQQNTKLRELQIAQIEAQTEQRKRNAEAFNSLLTRLGPDGQLAPPIRPALPGPQGAPPFSQDSGAFGFPPGRPRVQNNDGSFSSELSATVTDPRLNAGQPTNIPTMFSGRQESEDAAIQRIIDAGGVDPETGRQLSGFDSTPEAVDAARARSASFQPAQAAPAAAPRGFAFTPSQIAFARSMGPQEGTKFLAGLQTADAARRAEGPRTALDAGGFRRFLTGPQTGQRTFPDAALTPDTLSAAREAQNIRIAQGSRAPQRPSAQEAKITEIMSTFSVDRQVAAGIATGTKKIITDPVSGNPFMVDMIDGTSQPLSAPGPAVPDTSPGPRRTLFEAREDTAGLVPAIGAGAQRVLGQFGADVAPEQTQARQDIRTAQNGLIRSLSINPRFPVGEIKRLQQEINIAPSIFDSGVALGGRMISIDQSLEIREQNELRAAANTALPAKTRQDAATAAKDIANFRQIMGVPPRVSSDEEFDQLPSGAKFISPDGKVRVKP